jgi:microcystin-dependent protein
MSSPYLSEIRIMAFNYPPKGWQLCNGQTLAINTNQALFSLIGTTYGGDGIRTFLLPNLQGLAPLHFGNGFTLGQKSGETTHTLNLGEMPMHNHLMSATAAAGGTDVPSSTDFLAQGAVTNPLATANLYGTGNSNLTFAAAAISNSGNGQPHPNQQPYLVLNFCISMQGIFPSRN